MGSPTAAAIKIDFPDVVRVCPRSVLTEPAHFNGAGLLRSSVRVEISHTA